MGVSARLLRKASRTAPRPATPSIARSGDVLSPCQLNCCDQRVGSRSRDRCRTGQYLTELWKNCATPAASARCQRLKALEVDARCARAAFCARRIRLMKTKCRPRARRFRSWSAERDGKKVDRGGGHEQPREQRIGTASGNRRPNSIVTCSQPTRRRVRGRPAGSDRSARHWCARANAASNSAARTRSGTSVLRATVITAEVATATRPRR